MKLHMCAWLAFGLGLVWPASVAGQSASDVELGRVSATLKELKSDFDATVRRQPTNNGARTMAAQLGNVLQAIEGFNDGQTTNTELRTAARTALREANRFNSANARKAQDALKKLETLAPRLTAPGADALAGDAATAEEAAPEPEPGTVANAEPAPSEGPRVVVEDVPEGRQPSTGLFYTMFGVFIIALLATAFALFATQKRMARSIDTRIDKLAERVENFEFAAGGTDDFKNVKFHEMKMRLDSLEVNMSDFLERVEVRMQATQQALEDLNQARQSASGNARLEKLDFQVSELIGTTERLKALEAKLNQTTKESQAAPGKSSQGAGNVVPIPVATAAELGPLLTALGTSLAALHNETKLVALQKRVEALVPAIEAARASQALETEDWHTLGRIVQLCYASAYNENIMAAYRKLQHALSPLGISVEDAMTGRMAFSDFYAENVALDGFLTQERFRSETFPDFEVARREVEANRQTGSGVAGTVLFTLLPTVVLQVEGGRKVLAKGVYVVRG